MTVYDRTQGHRGLFLLLVGPARQMCDFHPLGLESQVVIGWKAFSIDLEGHLNEAIHFWLLC